MSKKLLSSILIIVFLSFFMVVLNCPINPIGFFFFFFFFFGWETIND